MYGIQVAGVEATISTFFDTTESFDRDEAKQLIRQYLREFRDVNLTPENVTLIGRDDLFRFNFKVNFFAGLGTIDLAANRIEMAFRDMKTPGDVELVSSILTRASTLLGDKATHANSALTVAFHAHILSGGNQASYFETLIPKVNGEQPQAIAFYRAEPDFLPEVRAAIERSNSINGGVFFNWNGMIAGALTSKALTRMKESIYSFLTLLNLTPADGTTLL